eukprot:3714296-Alexandrium_andersonii.AAC.1
MEACMICESNLRVGASKVRVGVPWAENRRNRWRVAMCEMQRLSCSRFPCQSGLRVEIASMLRV